MPPSGRPHPAVACLLVAGLLVGPAGCQSMRRRITVNAVLPNGQPARDALVLVDGEEIGYAPASVDFTHYASREITVIKNGYETAIGIHDFDAPLHQQPGPDFVTDNFLPVPVTDRRELTVKLEPRATVSTDDLLRRAGALRGEAVFGR